MHYAENNVMAWHNNQLQRRAICRKLTLLQQIWPNSYTV